MSGPAAAPARPEAGRVVSMRQPVYTFDIDFAGIVSNIVYLRWSEIWRLEFLGRLGVSVQEMMGSGIVPTMVRQELNYRKSMRLGQSALLEGWVERVGNSSVVLWLEMCDAASGELCCDNRQVMVMVDGRTGASTPIPSEWREKLRPLGPAT